MIVTIEIQGDQVDLFVLDALKEHLEVLLSIECSHPEDIKYNKKMVKALNRVIEHYGGDL